MTPAYVFRTLRQMILALMKRVSILESTGAGGGGSAITSLTADVTATGPGAAAATIANDAVSNAKAANMAQSTIKGRAAAAGTGDPTDLTPDQTSTILDGATDPFLRTSAATSGAPSDAEYVVMALSGSLSQERRLTAGSGISITDGGANGDVTLTATGAGASGGSGSIYPAFHTPVDADYAWINQGGASVTVNPNGSIHLQAPAHAGDSLRIRKKALTSGSPTLPVTIAFLPFMMQDGSQAQHVGLVLRQSSDGKLLTWSVLNTPGAVYWAMWYQRWNSPTSFNANTNSHIMLIFPGMPWLQYDEDATNRYFRYSLDGYNFIEFYSEARTNFLVVDEVGFFANETTNLKPCGLTLYSFDPT